MLVCNSKKGLGKCYDNLEKQAVALNYDTRLSSEEFKTLPYFQTNKLGYHSFIDAARR